MHTPDFRSVRGIKQNKYAAHITAASNVPVTPAEERLNKSFIRVVHSILED